MKLIITLLFSISSVLLWGQTKSDYEIYSTILNQLLAELEIRSDSSKSILVADESGKENIDEDFEESLSIDVFPSTYQIHFYDKSKEFNIFSDNEFKSLLLSFRNEIVLTNYISADSLNVDFPVSNINRRDLNKIFKTNRKRDPWKAFYRKYNNSLGYFEFLKIAYSDKYAILYYTHRANPLTGNGRFEILLNDSGKWIPCVYCNVWFN